MPTPFLELIHPSTRVTQQVAVKVSIEESRVKFERHRVHAKSISAIVCAWKVEMKQLQPLYSTYFAYASPCSFIGLEQIIPGKFQTEINTWLPIWIRYIIDSSN